MRNFKYASESRECLCNKQNKLSFTKKTGLTSYVKYNIFISPASEVGKNKIDLQRSDEWTTVNGLYLICTVLGFDLKQLNI